MAKRPAPPPSRGIWPSPHVTDTITQAREAEILRHIPSLRCPDEIDGFRKALGDQGEITSEIYRALMARMEQVKSRGAR